MSTEKNIANQPDQHLLQEKGLKAAALALPADTALDYGADIDLGFELPNTKDARLDDVWVSLHLPAMTVALLANGETVIANIYAGTAASPTLEIIGGALTVEGVTAVDPSVAITKNVKLPANCPRYIRAGVIASTSSAKNVYDLTVGLVF